MSSMLSTGTSALLSYQRSLAAVGNNVANASTPGYSRQLVELSTRPTDGVQVSDVKRVSDTLVNRRLLDSTGELNRLQQVSALADQVDGLFSDEASNLSGVWSGFFDALSGLASDPGSSVARQAVLQGSQTLAGRFNQLDASLDRIDSDLDTTLSSSVDQVNDLTAQIARLNRQISNSSEQPQLRDQRDQLIEQLAGLTGGTTATQDDGSINVYSRGGQPLVVGTTAMSLSADSDPFRPDRLVLSLSAQGQNIPLDDSALGGSLGGLVEFRREVLDPTINELGRLATALADGVNQLQASGSDLAGAAGTDLFTIEPPALSADAGNTGNASLQASIANIGQLDGGDLILHYNAGGWTATRVDNGATQRISGSGAATDPLQINGVAIVVDGSASVGDRFLLRPTGQNAGAIAVAFSDAERIAAANAVQGGADLDNVGNAVIVGLTVDDPAAPALRSTATIDFTDANQYTISVDGVESGPFDYNADSVIAANGWRFRLAGTPAAGDRFSIAATAAGSNDNANLLRMAGLEDSATLDNGNLTLSAAMAGLTGTAAANAARANEAYQAEQTINTDVRAERDSVSGVNLDQEAADLIKYQQAYQAAAKIIASADNIFQTLLQAV